ncbi:TPA: hypothetical protein ACNIQM_000739 [Citrobacter werkmanii]
MKLNTVQKNYLAAVALYEASVDELEPVMGDVHHPLWDEHDRFYDLKVEAEKELFKYGRDKALRICKMFGVKADEIEMISEMFRRAIDGEIIPLEQRRKLIETCLKVTK